MSNALNINGINISPGDQEIVSIDVGRIPSGSKIFVKAHIYRSKNPGPVMLVLAGVHGDEINGIEIVRRAIEKGLFENLLKGTVIAIPILNIYGFINFSREVPDGKDVNRSFPGNMRGSLASRVARTLTKKILPVVDFGIDFHTGGASRYNFPQVRYSKSDPEAKKMALTFGAPLTLKKPILKNSLRKVAKDLSIPMIVYEGGESLRLDGLAIEKGMDGLKRVMHSKGMINSSPKILNKMILIEKTSWIRASQAGLFTWSQKSGVRIRKGEPVGVINDPDGLSKIVVLSTRNGYIIGHNNAPVVNAGDALFHIGYDYREEKISDE
ncbi:MAG: succinylglutamate desuccinylase/aspartoacylase family protein [Bacteroidota bacterium]